MIRVVLLTSLLCVLVFVSCEGEPENNSSIEIDSQEQLSQIDQLNAEIVASPESSNGYYKRCLYYQSIGEWEKAKEDINFCLAMNNDASVYYFEKAKIMYALNDYENSEIYALETLERDSKYKEAHLILGQIYLRIPNYEMAMSRFDSVLYIDQYMPDPYFYKGMIFARVGDTLKAISSLQTAVEQNSDYFQAYLELANLYALNDSDDQLLALNYYNIALDLYPNSIEALLLKGTFCQGKGLYDEANMCYDKMLELEANNPVPFYHKAYVNMLQYSDDQPRKSRDSLLSATISLLDQAINIDPSYVEAYHNRGVCYEYLGDIPSAKTDYATALKVDPEFTLANEALDALN